MKYEIEADAGCDCDCNCNGDSGSHSCFFLQAFKVLSPSLSLTHSLIRTYSGLAAGVAYFQAGAVNCADRQQIKKKSLNTLTADS